MDYHHDILFQVTFLFLDMYPVLFFNRNEQLLVYIYLCAVSEFCTSFTACKKVIAPYGHYYVCLSRVRWCEVL